MRLLSLDPKPYRWLSAHDRCWHYGEYTANGGFNVSDTNRQITNLKKRPSASSGELYWKGQAVQYWGDILRTLLPADEVASQVTFVPVPGSKPRGHADYDERLLRVLQYMAIGRSDIDIRQVIVQTRERAAQHSSSRLTPNDLCEMLATDPQQCIQPFKRIVFVVDDVITMGASFAAAKQILTGLPGVTDVRGLFLAKTVWPNPFAAAVLPHPFSQH